MSELELRLSALRDEIAWPETPTFVLELEPARPPREAAPASARARPRRRPGRARGRARALTGRTERLPRALPARGATVELVDTLPEVDARQPDFGERVSREEASGASASSSSTWASRTRFSRAGRRWPRSSTAPSTARASSSRSSGARSGTASSRRPPARARRSRRSASTASAASSSRATTTTSCSSTNSSITDEPVPRGHGLALEPWPAPAPTGGRPDARRGGRAGRVGRVGNPAHRGGVPRVSLRRGGPHEEAPAPGRARRRRNRRSGRECRRLGDRGPQLAPDGHAAGQDLAVDLTVLQHGQTPLEGIAPVLTIENGDGDSRAFTATPTGKPGVYHADVVFPSEEPGRTWSGTTSARRTRSSPSRSPRRRRLAPLLQLAGALGLALALAAFTVLTLRRRRRGQSRFASRRPHEEAPLPRRDGRGRRRPPGGRQAGCMATVGLSPMLKSGHAAGKPWVVTIRVLQHGRTPLAGAKPEVRIRNAAGRLFRFKATPLARVGSYRARVVFPAPGRYTLGVYDGFPVAECARAHLQAGADRPRLSRSASRRARAPARSPGLGVDIAVARGIVSGSGGSVNRRSGGR